MDANELDVRGRGPLPPEESEVTIACSCGVSMHLVWPRSRTVCCFGCGRRFDAPPGVSWDDAPPWKPDRIGELERTRARRRRHAALALAVIGLAFAALGLWLWLGAQAGGPVSR